MTTSPIRTAFRASSAFIAWATLIAQYGIMLSRGDQPNILAATLSYVSYFTLTTNFLVALAFTGPLLPKTNQLHQITGKAGVRAAVALYISVVAVVYHTLLASQWNPQGLQLVTDISLHTIVPALYVADWLFLSEKAPMRYGNIPYWLAYPVGFGLWTLARGALTGVYPYFFFDISALGLVAVLTNMAAFAAFYALAGAAMIFLGRQLARNGAP